MPKLNPFITNISTLYSSGYTCSSFYLLKPYLQTCLWPSVWYMSHLAWQKKKVNWNYFPFSPLWRDQWNFNQLQHKCKHVTAHQTCVIFLRGLGSCSTSLSRDYGKTDHVNRDVGRSRLRLGGVMKYLLTGCHLHLDVFAQVSDCWQSTHICQQNCVEK